jgi:hypothetical protein
MLRAKAWRVAAWAFFIVGISMLLDAIRWW